LRVADILKEKKFKEDSPPTNSPTENLLAEKYLSNKNFPSAVLHEKSPSTERFPL